MGIWIVLLEFGLAVSELLLLEADGLRNDATESNTIEIHAKRDKLGLVVFGFFMVSLPSRLLLPLLVRSQSGGMAQALALSWVSRHRWPKTRSQF
jgi:hypothetical protein